MLGMCGLGVRAATELKVGLSRCWKGCGMTKYAPVVIRLGRFKSPFSVLTLGSFASGVLKTARARGTWPCGDVSHVESTTRMGSTSGCEFLTLSSRGESSMVDYGLRCVEKK